MPKQPKKPKPPSRQIAFRSDVATTKRLDRLVETLKQDPDYQGLDVTRSTAIRMLVLKGLDSMELQLGLPFPGPKEPTLAARKWWHKRERDAKSELDAIQAYIETWDERFQEAFEALEESEH